MTGRWTAPRRPWQQRKVAIGIAGWRPVGTIALEECDRHAAGAVRRNRTAEFGRYRSSSKRLSDGAATRET